jgi:hypothetical protein
MKTKIALALIIGLFFTELSFSQIRFGVRGSISMTNITEVHSWSKSRGGFQLAALSLIPITHNDILFFQPEINFSAQGEFDQPITNEGKRERQKVFLSYINVPLNVKVYFTDAEDEFFALGGPYFGFQIGKNIESKDFPTEAERNHFNTFDMGATLGVGYSLNRQLEFSLRYSYGLLDQVSNDLANRTNSTSILNLGISFIFF